MEDKPYKIAIVGPESCGKTTLAQALLAQLQAAGERAVLVPEFARAYYADRSYYPTPADVLAIAQGQLAAEAQALTTGARWLLCDSTVLTCLIWSEEAFGQVALALAALYQPQDYALTLLPLPDIAWEPDPLRSYPFARERLLTRYRAALQEAKSKVWEIAGSGPVRVEQAWQALRQICPDLPKI